MEVEQALVEAEMESEVAGLQQEKDALEALHNKMTDLETTSQQEKEKVRSHLRSIARAPESCCLCGETVNVTRHMRFLSTECKCVCGSKNIVINAGVM